MNLIVRAGAVFYRFVSMEVIKAYIGCGFRGGGIRYGGEEF
jgi:hypothetical protein